MASNLPSSYVLSEERSLITCRGADQEPEANRSGMDWSSITNPFGDSEKDCKGSRQDGSKQQGSDEQPGNTGDAGADKPWLFFKVAAC